jgi:hypothetical protein
MGKNLIGGFYEVRAFRSVVEEIYHEGGPTQGEPLIKASVGAIIKNPFAGRYVEDLSSLTEASASLGTELGRRAVALLGGAPVEGYGKGGIAGILGDQDHVVACITTIFGDAFRDAVGGGKAWISSVTKTAAAGTPLDIPLAFKDEVYVRSHYDAITFHVPDGPKPDELLICIAVSTGGRIHQRSGGMSVLEYQSLQS